VTAQPAASRTASAAPLAERVAGTIAAAVEELGLRADGGAVAATVGELASEPLALYARHAVWPSALTAGGPPIELSLRLSRADGPAVRCVVDVTDHRRDGAVNVARYRAAAMLVGRAAGVTEDGVTALCRTHLDGAPAAWQARAMHGLGYAGGGWARGSVYFRTGWLDRDELARRLPSAVRALEAAAAQHGSPTAGSVEVMGYDFVPGALPRSKAYLWVPCPPPGRFASVLGHHPDLAPARALLDALDLGDAGSHALMLQVAGAAQRLFVLRSYWGGPATAAARRVLPAVRAATGVDVAPLGVLSGLAHAHGLELSVALVAVGCEQGMPSATVYLWPRPAAARGQRPAVRAVRDGAAALDRGTGFLLDARSDGGWSEDRYVTAFVAGMLLTAAPPERRRELRATAEHLAATYRRDEGWARWPRGEADLATTALALGVLAHTGHRAPDGAAAALLRLQAAGPPAPASTAAVLLALLQATVPAITPLLDGVFALVGSQRADGAWPSPPGGEAMTLWQVAHALRAYERGALAGQAMGGPSRLAAGAALRRAAARVRCLPVGVDPGALAAYLGARAMTVGDAGDPAVLRAVATLAALQGPDGHWTAPAGGGGAPPDRALLTTATAVGALQCLRAAARRGR
jgi:hypothetical protein